jgi:hypothetical protein
MRLLDGGYAFEAVIICKNILKICPPPIYHTPGIKR